MILQLALHVQNFLHQNNVPPPSSFYEEMMAKKKRDSEQQKAAEIEKKEKERKANVIQVEEEVDDFTHQVGFLCINELTKALYLPIFLLFICQCCV
jgi:hypothetical protein